MPAPRSLLAIAATALAVGAAADVASADSISYIKDGNVWLTTPDGARQFQVTDSGAYSYASQADDGTIMALTGETLHRLDRLGNVTAELQTPVSDGPPPASAPDSKDTSTNYFHGPFDPEISPDGSKVSYTYYWQHYSYNPILNVMENRLESGTAITHPDRLTAWDEFGGNLTGWKDGSWIDDDSLMRSDAGVPLSEHAVVNDGIAAGGKSTLVRWFREGIMGSWDVKDPELSRDGSKLAAVAREPSPVDWHIRVYRTNGVIPAEPEACFRITPEGKHDSKETAPASPSWSPDGTGLAYSDAEGVQVVTGVDLSGACALPAGAALKVIVPGAKQPDWGPADVPASRPAKPAAPAAPVAAPQAPVAAPTTGAAAGRVTASSLRRTSKGLAVRVVAPGAGTLAVTVKGAGKARAKVAKAGPKTLTIRLAAKKRRALRGKLATTVTFSPNAGGAAQTAKKRLAVR